MTFAKDYPFAVDVQLAWGDMDAFGHVNNTRYFRYFEDVRIAFFEACGIAASASPRGVGAILAGTSCRFRAPLTYPDRLRVGTRVSEVGVDRFTMEYAVWSDALQRVAATGEAIVVGFDYDEGKKAALPEEWIAAMNSMGSR